MAAYNFSGTVGADVRTLPAPHPSLILKSAFPANSTYWPVVHSSGNGVSFPGFGTTSVIGENAASVSHKATMRLRALPGGSFDGEALFVRGRFVDTAPATPQPIDSAQTQGFILTPYGANQAVIQRVDGATLTVIGSAIAMPANYAIGDLIGFESTPTQLIVTQNGNVAATVANTTHTAGVNTFFGLAAAAGTARSYADDLITDGVESIALTVIPKVQAQPFVDSTNTSKVLHPYTASDNLTNVTLWMCLDASVAGMLMQVKVRDTTNNVDVVAYRDAIVGEVTFNPDNVVGEEKLALVQVTVPLPASVNTEYALNVRSKTNPASEVIGLSGRCGVWIEGGVNAQSNRAAGASNLAGNKPTNVNAFVANVGLNQFYNVSAQFGNDMDCHISDNIQKAGVRFSMVVNCAMSATNPGVWKAPNGSSYLGDVPGDLGTFSLRRQARIVHSICNCIGESAAVNNGDTSVYIADLTQAHVDARSLLKNAQIPIFTMNIGTQDQPIYDGNFDIIRVGTNGLHNPANRIYVIGSAVGISMHPDKLHHDVPGYVEAGKMYGKAVSDFITGSLKPGPAILEPHIGQIIRGVGYVDFVPVHKYGSSLTLGSIPASEFFLRRGDNQVPITATGFSIVGGNVRVTFADPGAGVVVQGRVVSGSSHVLAAAGARTRDNSTFAGQGRAVAISDWINSAVAQPPTAPTLNPATGITTSGCSLSWSDATGETSYRVDYRVQGATLWSAGNTYGADVLTGGITGIIPSATPSVYEVSVVAVNANGSTRSNVISFTPTASSSGGGGGSSIARKTRTLVVLNEDRIPPNYQAANAPMIDKDPAATLDYYVDWTDWLTGTGEAIATVVWGIPSEIVKVADVGTAPVLGVRLSGGVVGKQYKIDCTVTSSAGNSDSRFFILNVKDR